MLAQPPDRAGVQIAVLLLPGVERRFGYAKAAARVHHWRAGSAQPGFRRVEMRVKRN
jgi:hypothetical protein